MRFVLTPLIIGLACSVGSRTASIVVESRSPALRGGQVAEPVGLRTLGGVFTPILQAGCALPCEVTNTFSTAEDNQTEILIFLFRGSGSLVSENHSLGIFAIVDLPPLPRGEPQVSVTLKAASGDIVLAARESSGARLRIERRGT